MYEEALTGEMLDRQPARLIPSNYGVREMRDMGVAMLVGFVLLGGGRDRADDVLLFVVLDGRREHDHAKHEFILFVALLELVARPRVCMHECPCAGVFLLVRVVADVIMLDVCVCDFFFFFSLFCLMLRPHSWQCRCVFLLHGHMRTCF